MEIYSRLVCTERQRADAIADEQNQPAILENLEQLNNALPNDDVDTTINTNSRKSSLRQNSPLKTIKAVNLVVSFKFIKNK